MACFWLDVDANHVFDWHVHFELLLVNANLGSEFGGLCITHFLHSRVLVTHECSVVVIIITEVLSPG